MNVLCVVTDDGPPTMYNEMPYMGINSEANGWVSFPQSINVIPICGPSRTVMLTGQHARRTGNSRNDVGWDNFEVGLDPTRTLGRTIQRHGHHTSWLGKYINGYPWADLPEGDEFYIPPGWDRWVSPRPNVYVAPFRWMFGSSGSSSGLGENSAFFNSGEYRVDEEVNKVIEHMAEARSQNRPFMTWWAPMAPHRRAGDGAVVPAPRHENATVTTDVTAKPSFNEADITDKPTWVQTYNLANQQQQDDWAAEHDNVMRTMLSVDEGMETIVNWLDSQGILDDTVIFFWSDNGFLYGEHRHKFGKGVYYEESIGLGLKVRWPGVAGRTDNALVTQADIAPTVCDITGAVLPDAPDGMSIAPRVQDPEMGWRDAVLVERDSEIPTSSYRVGTYTAVRTDTHTYVELEDGTGDKELYDLDADPYQLVNAAGTSLAAEAKLAAKLAKLKAAQIPPSG